MSKEERIRIIHIALCLINIGCLFFPFVKLSGGTPTYSFWCAITGWLGIPMFLMRLIYLQYVLWGVIAVFEVIFYINKIKNKNINKKMLFVDIFLWVITILEIVLLEDFFYALYWR